MTLTLFVNQAQTLPFHTTLRLVMTYRHTKLGRKRFSRSEDAIEPGACCVSHQSANHYVTGASCARVVLSVHLQVLVRVHIWIHWIPPQNNVLNDKLCTNFIDQRELRLLGPRIAPACAWIVWFLGDPTDNKELTVMQQVMDQAIAPILYTLIWKQLWPRHCLVASGHFSE